MAISNRTLLLSIMMIVSTTKHHVQAFTTSYSRLFGKNSPAAATTSTTTSSGAATTASITKTTTTTSLTRRPIVLPIYHSSPLSYYPLKASAANTANTTPTSTRTTTTITTNTTTNNTSTTITGWKSKLLKASDFASLLCVLDCTILPLVTVVLPLLGFVSLPPAQMEFLHHVGHQIALWFVLPVGSTATFLNYKLAHQKKRILSLGVLGLVLVALANAPHALIHLVQQQYVMSGSNNIIWRTVHPVMHLIHHGVAHRMTNILGCACLLGSNYWSKQSGKCLHGHDHNECSTNDRAAVTGGDHSHSNDANNHDHKH